MPDILMLEDALIGGHANLNDALTDLLKALEADDDASILQACRYVKEKTDTLRGYLAQVDEWCEENGV